LKNASAFFDFFDIFLSLEFSTIVQKIPVKIPNNLGLIFFPFCFEITEHIEVKQGILFVVDFAARKIFKIS